MEYYHAYCEAILLDDAVNIVVNGDELNRSDGPHTQSFLNFTNPISFRQLKEALDDAGCPGAHIDKRKGSVSQAGNYCLKEHYAHIAKLFENEKGRGAWDTIYRPGSKPSLVVGWDIDNARPDRGLGPGGRSDIEKFKTDVKEGVCTEWDYAMDNHSGLCARAEGYVRQYISRYAPVKPLTPEEWSTIKARDGLVDWITEFAIPYMFHPDPNFRRRKVAVVEDAIRNGGDGGNSHKSDFAEWFPALMAVIGKKVQVLGPGKLADMAIQLNSDIDILIIDIPQARSDVLQFAFVEQLKNGKVDCPKYHSCTIVLKNKPIPVMILCNHHPAVKRRVDFNELDDEAVDAKKKQGYTLSNDRWVERAIMTDADVVPTANYMLPTGEGWFPVAFNEGVTHDVSELEDLFEVLTLSKKPRCAFPLGHMSNSEDDRRLLRNCFDTFNPRVEYTNPPPEDLEYFSQSDNPEAAGKKLPRVPKTWRDLFKTHSVGIEWNPATGKPQRVEVCEAHFNVQFTPLAEHEWVSSFNLWGHCPRVRYDSSTHTWMIKDNDGLNDQSGRKRKAWGPPGVN